MANKYWAVPYETHLCCSVIHCGFCNIKAYFMVHCFVYPLHGSYLERGIADTVYLIFS